MFFLFFSIFSRRKKIKIFHFLNVFSLLLMMIIIILRKRRRRRKVNLRENRSFFYFLHLHWTIKKNFPEKFSIKKIKIIIINRERERESKRMNRKEMMSIKFILLFVNHGCEWKIANCRMGKESFSGRKNLFVFYGKYSLSFFLIDYMIINSYCLGNILAHWNCKKKHRYHL